MSEDVKTVPAVQPAIAPEQPIPGEMSATLKKVQVADTAVEVSAEIEVEKTKDGFKFHGQWWTLPVIVTIIGIVIIALMFAAQKTGIISIFAK